MQAIVYSINDFNKVLEKQSNGDCWLQIDGNQWWFAVANDSDFEMHDNNEGYYDFVSRCIMEDLGIKVKILCGVYVDITESSVVVTYD